MDLHGWGGQGSVLVEVGHDKGAVVEVGVSCEAALVAQVRDS